jgi:hypothetical protein
MSMDIKVGVTGRHAKPSTWSKVISAALYFLGTLVFAYPLIPTLVERGSIHPATGGALEALFAVLALWHLVSLVLAVKGLRKQRKAAV